MTAGSPGARASVDQHAAEIRDVLSKNGRSITPGALLSYAQGFAEAAIARGWWPAHRRENLLREEAGHAAVWDDAPLDHAGAAEHEATVVGDWLGTGPRPIDHFTMGSFATSAYGHDVDRLQARPLGAEHPELDWESLRLAAVCRLLIESQGLGI